MSLLLLFPATLASSDFGLSLDGFFASFLLEVVGLLESFFSFDLELDAEEDDDRFRDFVSALD